MNIENIIKEKKGTIVDVRSLDEFSGGNAAGSINIPLQELPYRIDDLKEMNAPIVLCCASGVRSRQAQLYLSQSGIECVDGGSWQTFKFIQSQTK